MLEPYAPVLGKRWPTAGLWGPLACPRGRADHGAAATVATSAKPRLGLARAAD